MNSVRAKAASAIIVILCGVFISVAGAWMGEFVLSIIGLVIFVAGFLYGYWVVEGLPGNNNGDDEDETADADPR